jgi:hypothetical protein
MHNMHLRWRSPFAPVLNAWHAAVPFMSPVPSPEDTCPLLTPTVASTTTATSEATFWRSKVHGAWSAVKKAFTACTSQPTLAAVHDAALIPRYKEHLPWLDKQLQTAEANADKLGAFKFALEAPESLPQLYVRHEGLFQ